MEYKKCIKTVDSSVESKPYFVEGGIYRNTNYSDELWDEEGVAHTVGSVGEEWHDKHFRELTDEEWLQYYSDCYADMPNHDEIETKELQESIKRRIQEAVVPYKAFYDYFKELYGTGLEVANWHLNGDMEPFDDFFEYAESELLYSTEMKQGNYRQALEQIVKMNEEDKLIDAQYLALVALGEV